MSRTSRSGAFVAAGLTLGTATMSLLFAPSAFAAESSLPALTVVPTTVQVNESFTVGGADCLPKDSDDEFGVVVYLDGDPSNPDLQPVDGQLNEDGTWTAKLTVATAGEHSIDAFCGHYNVTDGDTSEDYPTASITVTAATAAATSASASAVPAAATSTAPDFKPGAKPNTPGISSTSSSKTTGTAAAPGQKVVKVLKGFKPGEKVDVVLHSSPVDLGIFPADANGVLTVEFTVPAGTPLGNHTLAYTGNMGSYFEEPLTLTADGKALAYTGASIAMPLIGGTVLVGAGAGALVLGRRRRTTGAVQA